MDKRIECGTLLKKIHGRVLNPLYHPEQKALENMVEVYNGTLA